MKSISEMLSSAVGHQQAGRLQDAEALYREILARDDRQADAWHLLGTIAHQIGDHVVAIDLIGHAIELESRNANFHCNLGNALLATGQMDEAEQSYRRALDRKRDFPLAWFNLSSLLAQTGQLDEAITGYQEAIRLKPRLRGSTL